MRTFLAGLMATIALPCSAADISIKGNTVFIAGTIDRGDYEVFLDKTKSIDQPMTVVLHSRGGLLSEAFRIGGLIRASGWDTKCEFVCFSAASMIGWQEPNVSQRQMRRSGSMHLMIECAKNPMRSVSKV